MGKTHVDSLVRFKLFKDFVGEFDPGSGRTLAVRLMHASRAKLFSSLLQKMTAFYQLVGRVMAYQGYDG